MDYYYYYYIIIINIPVYRLYYLRRHRGALGVQ